jgi:Cu/Ag efflux pump CusA
VGLLTRYSNRSDVLHELGLAVSQLEQASRDASDRKSVRSVRSPDRKSRIWGLAERLSLDDIQKIVVSYEAGELRRDIAARYKINISSVGRLLRQWRAERNRVA